jgi:hypothetical protein
MLASSLGFGKRRISTHQEKEMVVMLKEFKDLR